MQVMLELDAGGCWEGGLNGHSVPWGCRAPLAPQSSRGGMEQDQGLHPEAHAVQSLQVLHQAQL